MELHPSKENVRLARELLSQILVTDRSGVLLERIGRLRSLSKSVLQGEETGRDLLIDAGRDSGDASWSRLRGFTQLLRSSR